MKLRGTVLIRPLVLIVLATCGWGCQFLPPLSESEAADPQAVEEQASRRDLRARCRSYVDGLAKLREELAAGTPGLAEEIRKAAELIDAYYTSVLAGATAILSGFPADLPAQIESLADLKDLRNNAEKDLSAALGELPDDADDADDAVTWAFSELDKEKQLYDIHIAPELKGRFVENHAVRVDLLTRKYFSGDEDDKGNFLEAYINSRLPFVVSTELPASPEDDPWYRTRGVSHFETTLRLEPLVIFEESDENPALFGTFGMVYHFFPEYEPQLFEANPREGFASQWIQRIGVRVGAGAQDRDDEGADFVYGAGLQVRSFTLWGTHNPESSEFGFGIGVSDLEWIKGAIPVWK